MFTVEGTGVPAEVLAEVHAAADSAHRSLSIWGALSQPVLIVVHASHVDLERAVGHRGLSWLRAWAQFDRVDLQSPTTYGHKDFRGPLRELLTHELTHVLMYQRIATRDTWSRAWVPFWFREGMASWTARQGYRRGTPETLGRRLRKHRRRVDPLLDGEKLTRNDQPLAYGAAHWAFDRLVRDVGTEGVLRILDDMRAANACTLSASSKDQPSAPPRSGSGSDGAGSNDAGAGADCSSAGANFGDAFKRHVGVGEVAFARKFRRSLRKARRKP